MTAIIPPGAVSEALQLEMDSQEPWPEDAELYQPYGVEQILLPDQASCLSVQTYLRMSQLRFQVVQRTNAEHMSPSGKVPFVRVKKFVIAELDPIINFVEQKGVSLTDHLDSSQKADMRAYMSLVSNVLGNAESFVTWNDDSTLAEVTKPRYGSVYPWPLNSVLSWQKRRQVLKRLRALGWDGKSMDEVLNEVDNCCQALSERLDNQKFFFNNKPTELDALVFGHLFSILTTPLPDNRMSATVRNYKNLLELCQNVDVQYFKGPSGSQL
eukprot:maker-scaffold75_size407189-snap-gene-1.16 protein:Tk10125 transcript:maker-scaffold75_size407189-snap-gene-1.16-mRNA-1 annotation:"hypothetical protein DAPPUDRAFT_304425"